MKITLSCNGDHINTHCSRIGQCNDRLSEQGVLQSLRLAKSLKGKAFDFLFCSDIGHRRTTADFILEEIDDQHLSIIIDSRIREKNAEICTQKIMETFSTKFQDLPDQQSVLNRLFIKSDSFPSSREIEESESECIERTKSFLEEIKKTYPSSAQILILGNPVINSYLIGALLGEEKDFHRFITSPCSLSRYELLGDRTIEQEFNTVRHLHLW